MPRGFFRWAGFWLKVSKTYLDLHKSAIRAAFYKALLDGWSCVPAPFTYSKYFKASQACHGSKGVYRFSVNKSRSPKEAAASVALH